MRQPSADAEPPETPGPVDPESAQSLQKLHWYSRIPEGGRAFFWAVYFGIFVLSAVLGLVIALIGMSQQSHHLMQNPYSSISILVTGTTGEMWCFHRNLSIYMLGRPGKKYARWGIYVAAGALTISFLLAVAIVVLYMLQ